MSKVAAKKTKATTSARRGIHYPGGPSGPLEEALAAIDAAYERMSESPDSADDEHLEDLDTVREHIRGFMAEYTPAALRAHDAFEADWREETGAELPPRLARTIPASDSASEQAMAQELGGRPWGAQ